MPLAKRITALTIVAAIVACVPARVRAQDTPTAIFSGMVTDSLRQPVADAEVSLPDVGVTVRTNEFGGFRVLGVAPGTHLVSVRRVGFGPVETRIEFIGGETVQRRFVLIRSTLLEQIDVTAERLRDRRMLEFEEHQRLGLGRFLTRDQLEKQEHRRLPDVLRQLGGANVQQGRGTAAWLRSSRASGGRSIMGTTQLRDAGDLRDGAQNGACYAQVYLDNVLVYRGESGEPLFNLTSVQVHQIEAVEFYSGPSQLPLRYSGLNSPCGVLVIHTRRSFAPTEDPSAAGPHGRRPRPGVSSPVMFRS